MTIGVTPAMIYVTNLHSCLCQLMSTENHFLNLKCQLSIYHSSLASLKPRPEVPVLPRGLNFLFSNSQGLLGSSAGPRAWLSAVLTTALNILPPSKYHHSSLQVSKESSILPMPGPRGPKSNNTIWEDE